MREERAEEEIRHLEKAAACFGMVSAVHEALQTALRRNQNVEFHLEAGRTADGQLRKDAAGKMDGSCRIVIEIGARPEEEAARA